MRINLLLIFVLIFNARTLAQRKSRIEKSKSVESDSIIINPPYLPIHTSGPRDLNEASNYVNVKVYYATDRNTTSKGVGVYYNESRSSSINYGSCSVSIPRVHKLGLVESPSITSLELNDDLNKHFTLVTVSRQPKQIFIDDLKKKFNNGISNAFIFIHGYKNDFASAAKLTAQMCYDLDFKGIPLFYSWPSYNAFSSYSADENNIEWSVKNFKAFLENFAINTDAKNIYIVAHSMGNRLLSKAVYELNKENPNLNKRFEHIILAAPDIDSEIFKRDFSEPLAKSSKHVTLYVSKKDLALYGSSALHRGPRIGGTANYITPASIIEVIDASIMKDDFWGHSYISNNRALLDDLFYLINNNLNAEKRNLMKIKSKNGSYWSFKE